MHGMAADKFRIKGALDRVQEIIASADFIAVRAADIINLYIGREELGEQFQIAFINPVAIIIFNALNGFNVFK